MVIAALVLFYILTPILIMHLCHRYPLLNKVGAVIIAYIIGIIVGNIGLIPNLSPFLNNYILTNPSATDSDIETLALNGIINSRDLLAYNIYKLRDLLSSVTILLAIPLLLFSANIKQWKKLAGKTLTALLIAFVSIISVVVIGFFIFRENGPNDLWKISGMLIGVYTGGTPNLASLKMMLNIDANTYILTHTYDLVIGILYLAFVITIGQKVFNKILPKFPNLSSSPVDEVSFNYNSFEGVFKRNKLIPLLKAFGLAVAIFAVGGILSMVLPPDKMMIGVILTVTTLSILASLIPSINKVEKTFETGMFLILIFSLVVSSMASIGSFVGIAPKLLSYITLAVFGSLFLQVVLGKIFKVDADTTIITSVAFICSPPFVPVVAGALKNKNIIITGITIGIIGYAVGNYLGFIVAEVLSKLG